MTTAKAWRQKGTGRARVGALSVPHRYGGGVAFGPKPRHYTFKVNRKARRRPCAPRSASTPSAARRRPALRLFEKPSTKKAAEALAKWGADTPTLIVVSAEEEAAAKSFRNIPRVQVAQAPAVGVADVIGAARWSSPRPPSRSSRRAPARSTGGWRPDGPAPGDHPPGRLREELRPDVRRQVHVPRPRPRPQDPDRARGRGDLRRPRRAVRTSRVRSKPKRRGVHRGKTRPWKKAIVQLAPGERIELFEGAASD